MCWQVIELHGAFLACHGEGLFNTVRAYVERVDIASCRAIQTDETGHAYIFSTSIAYNPWGKVDMKVCFGSDTKELTDARFLDLALIMQAFYRA